jgi:hypothetical protein
MSNFYSIQRNILVHHFFLLMTQAVRWLPEADNPYKRLLGEKLAIIAFKLSLELVEMATANSFVLLAKVWNKHFNSSNKSESVKP